MKRIKLLFITLAVAVTAGAGVIALSAPNVAMAADSTDQELMCPKDANFLGFPMWYRGVADEATCDISVPDGENGLSQFIWHIVLNIIDILLRLVGIIAVFFIIYGGFQFMTSQSSPEGVAKARKTIMNAVIGLVVSMASVGIIQLIIKNLLG